jgi:hypothetical protein
MASHHLESRLACLWPIRTYAITREPPSSARTDASRWHMPAKYLPRQAASVRLRLPSTHIIGISACTSGRDHSPPIHLSTEITRFECRLWHPATPIATASQRTPRRVGASRATKHPSGTAIHEPSPADSCTASEREPPSLSIAHVPRLSPDQPRTERLHACLKSSVAHD